MAKVFDISALTLNPKEVRDLSQFIVELTYMNPDLRALHAVQTGIKMKEQIVLASQLGLVGLKANGACTRQTSGAKSTLTQKYWEPQGIEDTLENCQAEMDALYKAYFDKIRSYVEKYDISGSDQETLIALLVQNAMTNLILRAAWLGDKNVAAATSSVAGLIDVANVKFFDYLNGLWYQIFAGVTAGDIKRYTIALNSQTTTAAQIAVTGDLAKTYLDAVYTQSDPRLKAQPNAQFYVSGTIWEAYAKYLEGKGEVFSLDYTLNGFQTLKFRGKLVINMETVWDLIIQSYFYDNTVNQAYYLPNRIVFTIPENIPIGTDNESDLSNLEVWYNRDERKNKIAFGFTEDAKVLEEYLISVGY